MSEETSLTKKQAYLKFLLPRLNDAQIDRMIAAAKLDAMERPWVELKCKTVPDPYSELMAMVGCSDAKQKLTEMIADFRMRKIAAARGRNAPRAYYHACFEGNPGSAKTTVARLYAKVLASEGITASNCFDELSRSGLVGQYVGSTAAKVQDVFQRNRGGVIFVDEAYALCDSDHASNNTYGEEAINEMITCLENYPETVVIFAGYPDRMEEFLAQNPGLRSRVPYRVAFEDYTTNELIAISKVIAGEKGFEISDSAAKKLVGIFDAARKNKDFGNGRYARNIVEAAVRTKGIQLGVMNSTDLNVYINEYSDEALFLLDETCIVFDPKKSNPPEKPTIGF